MTVYRVYWPGSNGREYVNAFASRTEASAFAADMAERIAASPAHLAMAPDRVAVVEITEAAN